MDPIGTITQYFPFIDEETKNVLESVMSKASDYYDFIHRMCEFVLKNESPILVVYFTLQHMMMALEYKSIEMIREKYEAHQILGPILFFASVYQGTYEDIGKVHELADEVIATEPEDWISLEMHIWKFEADMRNYPTTMYQTSTMDKIQELIESSPHFGFYEGILNDYMEIRAHVDGDTDERLRCLDRGLEIAEKYNDKLRMAHLLIRKGNVTMNLDRKVSRESLEQAYQIVDSCLGIPAFYADILYNLSILDAIRGEFDSAIKGCLKAVSIRERAGLNSGNASYYLSIFYNAIGEPESGLEWGLMAEEQFKSRPYLINRAILNQIWALILLKKLTEAQALLDTSRESILKSGNENQLAWYHFVTGVMEMQQGDLVLSPSSIEQGLRIYENQSSAMFMELLFLHQLAKIEVMSSGEETVVSPSLAILEERALSDDLPGFLGMSLLLKAEVSILNNDDALLREIITQLQPLSERENLQFLKPYLEILLSKI